VCSSASEASFISRASTFSEVLRRRPTISPARKTPMIRLNEKIDQPHADPSQTSSATSPVSA